MKYTTEKDLMLDSDSLHVINWYINKCIQVFILLFSYVLKTWDKIYVRRFFNHLGSSFY